MTNNKQFFLAMTTEKYLYFLNTESGDDNSILKISRATGRPTVNDSDLFEDMMLTIRHFQYEWLSEELQFTRRCLIEQHKLDMALSFYNSRQTEYNHLSLRFKSITGNFNTDLKRVLGFLLKENELKQLSRMIHQRKSQHAIRT
jgi:hypothetical protein